jgi:hypothetical protein
MQSRSVNHGTVCPKEKPPEATAKAVLIFGLRRCVFLQYAYAPEGRDTQSVSREGLGAID